MGVFIIGWLGRREGGEGRGVADDVASSADQNLEHFAPSSFHRGPALLSTLSNGGCCCCCCFCFPVFWGHCKILGRQTQHCKATFDWTYSDPSWFGMLFEVKPFKSIPLIQLFSFSFVCSRLSRSVLQSDECCLLWGQESWSSQMLLHLSFFFFFVDCDWARLASRPESHRLIYTWKCFQTQLCTLQPRTATRRGS